MILLVDIGNTNVFMGLYDQGHCVKTYRTYTDVKKSSDDYAILISSFVKEEKVEGAMISSVVPFLTSLLKEAIDHAFNVNTFVVGMGVKSGLPIKMDHPLEVGSDLISVSVGAVSKYGAPIIICDLGTATKVIAVDKSGAFVGGAVLPGLKISLEALVGRTAQLPEVNLSLPKHVLGKNTVECMNSGTIHGHIGAILYIVKKIEEELGYPTKHVLTGGYAKIVQAAIGEDFILEENLILDGLYQIYLKNIDKKESKETYGGKHHEK